VEKITLFSSWRSGRHNFSFETAGVEFIDEDGGGAGVRLRKPKAEEKDVKLILTASLLALVAAPATAADNAACWDGPPRPEVSCTPLTEKLLLSLQFASRKTVLKVMKAEGRRPGTEDLLHFMGNARHGETGDLNVTFKDDQVVIIHAIIDEPHI
jgi:hypothetical protein